MTYSKLTMCDENRPDFAWLTPDSRLFLQRGYLTEGVTAETRIRQIADNAERRLNVLGFADKFYHYMARGYFSLSSPIWANYGTTRGLPISCFSTYIPDSIEGIMGAVAEVGMMSKLGGGTSGYFGDIRPRGSVIKNNGKSDGSFNFTKLFDVVIDVISQGTCYEKGTEVLTDKGFVDFRDVKKGEHKLAQVDEYNNISFTETYDLIEHHFTGSLYQYHGKKRAKLLSLAVTPNHRMVVEYQRQTSSKNYAKRKKYWKQPPQTEFVLAENLKLGTWNKMFIAGQSAQKSNDLSFDERLMIAQRADGEKTPETHKFMFNFKKERKINRLLWICENLGIKPSVTKNEKEGSTCISFNYDGKFKVKDLTWIQFDKISTKWCESFIDEISHWDGFTSHKERGRVNIQYSSVDKVNIDVIQAVCTLANKRTSLHHQLNRQGNRKPLYGISISDTPYVKGDSIKTSRKEYDDKVYCATVPLGRLVVRNNGTTLICGNSRKGQFAGYIDVEHSDIEEWLDIHTEGNPIQLMYYGVCIGHDWFEAMKNGDTHKRQIWAKILQRRTETGIPYLFFRDNANAGRPDVYKDKNLPIHNSNLCSEIMLPINELESFVCCLSSMNLLYYNEWKNTDAVETLTMFLDTVMDEFIEGSADKPFMERANRFARNHRALGIGVLGWHSFLQAHRIPFDSFEAMQKNAEIFKLLKEKTYAASKELAEMFGEPEILKGYGRRNTTLLSVAPTKSSSFILGSVSPSIEPFKSNYYVKDLAKIKTVYKNPFLEELLIEKGLDTDEIWESILVHDGSVQHLRELTQEEKDVFKTFSELSQLTIIQQAASRQAYIDQGQSINIMIHPQTPAKDLNQLYITAEELGIKALYYQFSISAAQNFNRNLLTCTNCEG